MKKGYNLILGLRKRMKVETPYKTFFKLSIQYHGQVLQMDNKRAQEIPNIKMLNK